MEDLAKRMLIRIIGLALFVGAFDLVDWIAHKDTYSFTVLDGITIPIIAYMIGTLITTVFGRLGKGFKRKRTKADK